MKKTRLLIALLVMLVAVSSYAQDSYRETVKQYVEVNGQSDKLKTLFTKLNETFFKKTEGVDLSALTERYVKERLNDQMTDLVLPMMKDRNVTEADLRTINSLLSTPEGKLFTAHQNEWNTMLPEKMVDIMLEKADMLDDGGNVAVNPEIPADYVAKFSNLMEMIKVKDTFKDLWGGKEGAQGMLPETFKTWFEENFIAIAVNSAYGIITPEDIDYGTMLYSNESYLKAQNVSGLKLEDIQSFGMDMVGGYIDWMQAQGAQLSSTATLMKSMLENKD